jgi:hypothetical protein
VSPVTLGNGDLREGLNLTAFFNYTPGSYLLMEAGVVMLNVVALGLLLASAAREIRWGYWRALMLIFSAALALKAAAVLLISHAPNPWSWLTPGFGAGLAGAFAVLLVLTRLPHRGRAAAALLALLAAVVLVNIIPENPYRPAPSYLLSGRISHFLSFSSMLHAISDIWPVLAMSFLLFGLPRRDNTNH